MSRENIKEGAKNPGISGLVMSFSAIQLSNSREFQKERAEGRAEGRVEILSNLVKDGVMSEGEAAKRLNMTEREFMKAAGIYLAQ